MVDNDKKVLRDDLKLIDKLIVVSHENDDYFRVCDWNILKCDLLQEAY